MQPNAATRTGACCIGNRRIAANQRLAAADADKAVLRDEVARAHEELEAEREEEVGRVADVLNFGANEVLKDDGQGFDIRTVKSIVWFKR